MRCIAAAKRCQIAKNEPFQVDLGVWRWSTKSNGINALCAFCRPAEFDGGVAGVWRCGRPGSHGATWTCRRGPWQEKVDGNGLPPWSMASDSFGLNVKGINRCDACKQPLSVEYVFLVAFTCRNCRHRMVEICRRCSPQPTSLCRTCPAPVIEGQAHREAVGPKILPTYPLEGCPLRQNALSSRAGASAKSCEPT